MYCFVYVSVLVTQTGTGGNLDRYVEAYAFGVSGNSEGGWSQVADAEAVVAVGIDRLYQRYTGTSGATPTFSVISASSNAADNRPTWSQACTSLRHADKFL